MKNNLRALNKTKNILIEDRVSSNSGLVKLLKSEIVQALSPYIEIDTTVSSLSVEIDCNGLCIDCHIKALTIKRFGLHY